VQSPRPVCALCTGLEDVRLAISDAHAHLTRMHWRTLRAELQQDFQNARGWRTLRGQAGRRREWTRALRALATQWPALRPPAGPAQPLSVRGHTIAWVTLRLNHVVQELYDQPPRARTAHRDHAPPWLRPLWEEAGAALAATDKQRFLRLKTRAVERMVARLLGRHPKSWRTVRRALETWRAAARLGDVDRMLYGRRRAR